MFSVRCDNQRCSNHKSVAFGACVGDEVIITVGKRNYLCRGLMAVGCESCATVTGEVPQPRPGEAAQEIRCPCCDKKCGEMFFGFAVASSGGRTVYAESFKVQCECLHTWEPRYLRKRSLTRSPSLFGTANARRPGAAGGTGTCAGAGANNNFRTAPAV